MLDLKHRGRVAQLVEQCPFKAWVAGSNPAALTTVFKYLENLGRVDFGHPRTPRRVSTQLGRQDGTESVRMYKAVRNHEEQYSIWPADRENPLGWRDAGKSGTKEECLAYINEVWTDMRPLSLRKKMEQQSESA